MTSIASTATTLQSYSVPIPHIWMVCVLMAIPYDATVYCCERQPVIAYYYKYKL